VPLTADQIPSAVPPPFRWTKRVAKLLLLTIILLSVIRFTWGIYADRRLAAAIDHIREANQPLEPEDFKQPSIPDDDNAARILQNAAAMIRAPELPPLKTFEQFETATLVDSLAIRAWVSENSASLHELHVARGKSVDWHVTFSNAPDTYSESVRHARLTPLRTLAILARNAGKIAHRGGNDAVVIEYWRDILAEGKASRGVPTLIGYRFASMIDSIASGQVLERASEVQIGPAPAASPQAVCRFITELLDESDLPGAKIRDFAADRLEGLQIYRMASNGATDYEAFQYGPNDKHVSNWQRAVAFAIGPVFTLRAARFAQLTTNQLNAANAPDYKTALAALPAVLSPKTTTIFLADRVDFFEEGSAQSVSRLIETDFHGILQRRAAAMALAIQLYRADHARALPLNAESLVPKYLSALPKDPYDSTGHAIRYAPTQFRRPILHSVGPTGIDNLAQQKWDLPPERLVNDYHTSAIIFDLTPMYPTLGAPTSMPK
jgi:hypothetical protein